MAEDPKKWTGILNGIGTWATPSWLTKALEEQAEQQQELLRKQVDQMLLDTGRTLKDTYVPEYWCTLGAIRAGYHLVDDKIVLDDWFRQVPDRYRNMAQDCAAMVFSRYYGQKNDNNTAYRFCCELYDELRSRMEYDPYTYDSQYQQAPRQETDQELRERLRQLELSRSVSRAYNLRETFAKEDKVDWKVQYARFISPDTATGKDLDDLATLTNNYRPNSDAVDSLESVYTYLSTYQKVLWGSRGYVAAWLVKTLVGIGHAWWESLDDATKRTAMLDMGPGQDALIVEPNLLPDLLELHEEPKK